MDSSILSYGEESISNHLLCSVVRSPLANSGHRFRVLQ